MGPGSGILGFRPCWCPSPFPSPSIISMFSIHSSSPAIGFHSSIFLRWRHLHPTTNPPPYSRLGTGTMVIGYPKRLRYHGWWSYIHVPTYVGLHTGWLRNKCPSREKAISRQPEEVLISKFQVLWERYNHDVIRPRLTSYDFVNKSQSKRQVFNNPIPAQIISEPVNYKRRERYHDLFDVFQRLWQPKGFPRKKRIFT